MKKYFVWSVVILGMITFMSFAQQDRAQEFVNQAMMANRYEIAIAQQANQRSSNEALKAYSLRLIEHHQRSLGELEEYARTNGLTIEQELNREHLEMVNTLGEADATMYDQSYRDAVIASHEKSIRLMESANNDAGFTDETLKGWITTTMPTLQSHLSEAQQLSMNTEQNNENLVPPVVNEGEMLK